MPGSELKSGARKIMLENSPKIFMIALILVALIAVFGELQMRLMGIFRMAEQVLAQLGAGEIPALSFSNLGISAPGMALALLLGFMSSVIYFGFTRYCLRLSRGGEANSRNLLEGFALFGKVFTLVILIWLFTFLWSLLFFFPAIPAMYRYRQAYYILMDDPEKTPLQCIRESKRLMDGNKLDLFLLELSFIGWWILSAFLSMLIPIPFPIVAIWIRPYMELTLAGYYNRLIRYSGDDG